MRYRPPPNWHGTDLFGYVASDGNGKTARARVTVTVIPGNDAPVAVGRIPAQALEEGGTEAALGLEPYVDDVDGDPAPAREPAGTGSRGPARPELAGGPGRRARDRDRRRGPRRRGLERARGADRRDGWPEAGSAERTREGPLRCSGFLMAIGGAVDGRPGGGSHRRWQIWGHVDVRVFDGTGAGESVFGGELRTTSPASTPG